MKKINKCNTKVKNPCKICLESVNNKTGLQCQGACNKWAHFSCLNYTPEKIQDIKTGILKVLCPCPGCKTTDPKEYLTNPTYTCPDQFCAAKQVPKCRSSSCPLNKQKQRPPCETVQVPQCRSSNCPLHKQKPQVPHETSQMAPCRSSNCPLNKQKTQPLHDTSQLPACRSSNCPLNKQKTQPPLETSQTPPSRSTNYPQNKHKRLPPREISFDSNVPDSTDEKPDPASTESNQSIDSHLRSCPSPSCISKNNQHSRLRSPSPPTPKTPALEKEQPPPSSTPPPKNIAQRVYPNPKGETTFAQKKSLSCSCIAKNPRKSMF